MDNSRQMAPKLGLFTIFRGKIGDSWHKHFVTSSAVFAHMISWMSEKARTYLGSDCSSSNDQADVALALFELLKADRLNNRFLLFSYLLWRFTAVAGEEQHIVEKFIDEVEMQSKHRCFGTNNYIVTS